MYLETDVQVDIHICTCEHVYVCLHTSILAYWRCVCAYTSDVYVMHVCVYVYTLELHIGMFQFHYLPEQLKLLFS